ncbi:DGA1 [Symbiodinium sp. CCMP2592]|nr:DGA1 [Symbiodinium sp. CCMP2592]
MEVDFLCAALQGLVLGGGLAMALLCDLRVLDHQSSLSLGNLSRGMVPCMLLSCHLLLSLSSAMDLYLTDDACTPAHWQAHVGDTVMPSTQQARAEAWALLAAAQLTRLAGLRMPIGVTASARFVEEAVALQLSLRCEPALTSLPVLCLEKEKKDKKEKKETEREREAVPGREAKGKGSVTYAGFRAALAALALVFVNFMAASPPFRLVAKWTAVYKTLSLSLQLRRCSRTIGVGCADRPRFEPRDFMSIMAKL